MQTLFQILNVPTKDSIASKVKNILKGKVKCFW